MEEVQQRQFTPIGQNDVLNRAPKTKEYTGRTKGLGSTVGNERAFSKRLMG